MRSLAAAVRRRQAGREARRERLLRALPGAVAALSGQFGARRVWLIGSLDAPWFADQSDVDLVVEGIDPARAGEAEELLVGLLDARVDLLLLEELDSSFRHEVSRTGRVLL